MSDLVARPLVDYGPAAEQHITQLAELIRAHPGLAGRTAPRWLAIKLLEGDEHIQARVAALAGTEGLLDAAHNAGAEIASTCGEDPDVWIAGQRYAAINDLVRDVIVRDSAPRITLSDRVDRIATHPLWGLPLFALVMWLVFEITANLSGFYIDWIDGLFSGPLARWAGALLGWVGLGGTWAASLVTDGVLAGVGGVLVFVPVLMFMYFFLGVLEDSGYMARAAFMADRFIHVIGLHGKSFIPMLLGFGCNVPGIYATRTLEHEQDRLLTALLVPFMSCGARLPVYMLLGAAFFGPRAGLLVFALYFTGVIIAIALGFVLRRTLFREKSEAPFIIELPPYRLPSLKNVWRHTVDHTRAFVEGAWTVVLAVTVLVWFLLAIPVGVEARFADVDADHSALAALGGAIAPAFAPAGFGDWGPSSALVTGFVAKEIVVSTLSTIYVGGADSALPEPQPLLTDLGEIITGFAAATWDTLRGLLSLLPGVNLFGSESAEAHDAALLAALRGVFTPLSAVAFCMFVLLTSPCVVTVNTLRREFGTRWMAFSVIMNLVVAWGTSTLVYQAGSLLGRG